MTNTTELLKRVKGISATSSDEETRWLFDEAALVKSITLIKDHYREAVVEAVADIHPYASGSNESTSMQEKAINTINEIMK